MPEEEDPTDPCGKRPMGQKKKKKKKGPSVGTLTTKSNTRIPVPLTEEEEEEQLQLCETIQRSIVERRAPNILYLEGVRPSTLEL